MFRFVFIVVFAIGVGESSFAQQFESNLHIGFNASQVDGDQFSGYSKLGIHAGLQVNYVLNEQWNVGTGIYYDELGSQKELQISSTPEEQLKIQLSLISVPIIATFHPESSNSLISKLRFKGGFRIGYLANSKIMDRKDEPVLEFYSKTDIAGTLGIQYEINDKWNILMKTFESITLLFNNNKVSEINANSLRMRNLTFALSYRL